MIDDDIVREVRAAREAFAADYGYDIRAMVAALHQVGVASGCVLVRLPPRTVTSRPNPSTSSASAPITATMGSINIQSPPPSGD